MRIRLPISVTDRSQITNLPADTQILKGRTTWRNLPSIFLILHDFDYLPRFFSVSKNGLQSRGGFRANRCMDPTIPKHRFKLPVFPLEQCNSVLGDSVFLRKLVAV
jgi:hypothetical protein